MAIHELKVGLVLQLELKLNPKSAKVESYWSRDTDLLPEAHNPRGFYAKKQISSPRYRGNIAEACILVALATSGLDSCRSPAPGLLLLPLVAGMGKGI